MHREKRTRHKETSSEEKSVNLSTLCVKHKLLVLYNVKLISSHRILCTFEYYLEIDFIWNEKNRNKQKKSCIIKMHLNMRVISYWVLLDMRFIQKYYVIWTKNHFKNIYLYLRITTIANPSDKRNEKLNYNLIMELQNSDYQKFEMFISINHFFIFKIIFML